MSELWNFNSEVSPSIQIKELVTLYVRHQWFSHNWASYTRFNSKSSLINQPPAPVTELIPTVTCLFEQKASKNPFHNQTPSLSYPRDGEPSHVISDSGSGQPTKERASHLHTLHLLFTQLPFIIKDNFMDRIFNAWAILIKLRQESAESEVSALSCAAEAHICTRIKV